MGRVVKHLLEEERRYRHPPIFVVIRRLLRGWFYPLSLNIQYNFLHKTVIPCYPPDFPRTLPTANNEGCLYKVHK